jgi:hypothetical protein
MSVCPHGTTPLPLDEFLWKLNLVVFENMLRNFKSYWNQTGITGTFYEIAWKFMTTSRWTFFRIRNVSDKICRGNQNTRLIFSKFFFPRKSFHLWDNVEKYGTARQATGDNITWRMRFACWITKATHTYRIFNTYCISTATVVTGRRLIVTFLC